MLEPHHRFWKPPTYLQLYCGVTGSLAGTGKLPVLTGWYFGQYFILAGTTKDLAGTPFILKRGAESLLKGANTPLFREKGGSRRNFDTKIYRPTETSVSTDDR
jgi:hypothetical protein